MVDQFVEDDRYARFKQHYEILATCFDIPVSGPFLSLFVFWCTLFVSSSVCILLTRSRIIEP